MVKQAADVFSLPGETFGKEKLVREKREPCYRATICRKMNRKHMRKNRATWVINDDMGPERQYGLGWAWAI
jgi:hypothetical protein